MRFLFQAWNTMTLTRLTLRNLVYHWRGNLAVLFGVWIGAAVLTGALLVGDSLRGSLRDRTLRQLAGVENVLLGGRFIRAEVVDGLPGLVKPAIFVQGTVRTTPTSGDPVSLSKVVLLGVDDRFWKDMPAPIADDPEFWKTDKNTVVVSIRSRNRSACKSVIASK